MAGLFVDTWGWLALRDKGDSRHEAAVLVFDEALVAQNRIVTTDYVLDEAFTLLFRRLAFSKAKESVDFLIAAIDDGSVRLSSVNPARFRQAVKLRVKFKDKQAIFTRCVRMPATLATSALPPVA